jgi:hypothetical protein
LGKNLERIIEGLHKELFDYILPVEEVKPVDRKNNGKRSNDWDLLDPERSLDEIVVEALKTVVIPSSRRLTRRDKRPFVTSYQLASIISKMFPHVVQASGLKFGGKGAGVNESFVSKLAGELSERIEVYGDEYPIEIDYIGTDYVADIEFSVNPDVNDGNQTVNSSVTGSEREIALFRLK